MKAFLPFLKSLVDSVQFNAGDVATGIAAAVVLIGPRLHAFNLSGAEQGAAVILILLAWGLVHKFVDALPSKP